MDERYEIAPQMKDYDGLPTQWVPYLMHFHEAGFASGVVNTDGLGFRVTYKGDRRLTSDDRAEATGLLVGSSTVFGVGAKGDRSTVASLLNGGNEGIWLNYGGRAFSSTQELLLFLLYGSGLDRLERVVVVSGMNDISLAMLSADSSNEAGPMFFSDLYRNAMREAGLSSYEKVKALLAGGSGSSRSSGALEADLQGRREYALRILERNINHWRLLCSARGIELSYVLQPLANWIRRDLSPEEEKLFAALDRREDNVWKVLRDLMDGDLYQWLTGRLREICERIGVPVYDLNAHLSDPALGGRWLFVDRVHLTDEGYRLVSDFIAQEVLS